jgi:hypothetical protein
MSPRIVVTEPFPFEGKEYEVRVTFDDSARVYEARAYLGDNPASPFAYRLHADDDYDFRRTMDERGLTRHLVDEARRDVVEKVWEGYLEACRQLEAEGK